MRRAEQACVALLETKELRFPNISINRNGIQKLENIILLNFIIQDNNQIE